MSRPILKICETCKKELPSGLFYYRKDKYKYPDCKTCHKIFLNKKRELAKLEGRQYSRDKEKARIWREQYIEKHGHSYAAQVWKEIKNDPARHAHYLDINRACWQKNRSRYKEKGKIYRERNKHKASNIYTVLKNNAGDKGRSFTIERGEFVKWYESQPRNCVYCKRPVDEVIKDPGTRARRLTFDRLDNSKGYSLDNMKLCCFRCNSMKGNAFSFKEMLDIGITLQYIYSNRNVLHQ